jgi:carbon starvation protein
MHGVKYLWITCLPMAWLVGATFTAAWQKIFSPVPAIGFLAQADKLEAALRAGQAANRAATQTLVFNARLDAAVCGLFLVLVAVILVDSIRLWAGILSGSRDRQVHEAPFVLSRLEAEEL